MNMITYASYCKRYRTFGVDNATYILKHTIQIFIAHNNARAFCVENNMDI